MRKRVLAVCLASMFLLLVSASHAFAASPTHLTGLCFIGPSEGWVSRSDGSLLHSTDGGTTWRKVQVAPTDVRLEVVGFSDSLHGWCGGWGEWESWQGSPFVAYATRDGGRTWTRTISLATDDFLSGSSVTAQGGHGYVRGAGYGGGMTSWVYWFRSTTDDAGATWKTDGKKTYYPDDPDPAPETPSGTCWAESGRWHVYSTGRIEGPTTSTSPTTKALTDITFFGKSGWAVGSGDTLVRTTNGGASWSTGGTGSGLDLLDVAFGSATNGCIVTEDGVVLNTKDGGISWKRVALTGLRDVTYADAMHAWAAAGDEVLYSSSDGGATWLKHAPVPTPITASYVKYSNPIAYDIKSLLTTRFRTSVDTSTVWAQLYVKTAAGNKYIYRGGIGTPNVDFLFPSWDGMGVDGRRLPSAAYDWVLELSKGGNKTTYTGKVSVSRIYFTFSGTSSSSIPVRHTGYMVPGNANVYVQGETTRVGDTVGLALSGPVAYSFRPVAWNVPVKPAFLNTVLYVRSPNLPKARGIHTFDVKGLHSVGYRITVIQ